MSDHRPLLLTIALMALVVLLNSTVLHFIAIRGVTPDILLVLLVFLAVRRGAMAGQLAGFAGGILEDMVSLSPLGFHALLRTVLGFFAGLLHGLMLMDTVVVPMLLLIGAVVIKGIAAALVAALFEMATDQPLLGVGFWIEVAYTAVLAPPLFALLGRIRLLRPTKREVAR